MPRGKRSVFAMFCPETGDRIGTIRLHKQKDGKSWKEFDNLETYSPALRKRVKAKLKEERHSS
jgi:hypothetical protein